MRTVLITMTALVVTACAAGRNGNVQIPSEKNGGSNVSGLAIVELNAVSHSLNCTASFLTPRVLLTSASCLEFKTEQGDLGTVQSVQTGEFLAIDTIWSVSAPTDPGDLGLIRLSHARLFASVFDIKPGAMPAQISTRFGGTGCEVNLRSATTEVVEVPLETELICPGGSGGVVFDTASRVLYAIHIGTTPHGSDQYTELQLYSAQLSQATADLLGAPELSITQAESPPEMMIEDNCTTGRRYNNGVCDEECQRQDPDCQPAQSVPCQSSDDSPDTQCPPGCATDPDCSEQANQNTGDLCQQQGLYGDGRCDSCLQLDPDCQREGSTDFCESQGLYNNGTCNRCPKPDPDCDDTTTNRGTESNDVCLQLGVYGNGTCDAQCPRPDPDCSNGGNHSPQDDSPMTPPASNSGTDAETQSDAEQPRARADMCEALNWYNDGECDTVCLRPDPDCSNAETEMTGTASTNEETEANQAPQDQCEQNNWYGDGQCDASCARPDPDCDNQETTETADDGSDLCELLNWYGDGECDTVCARPDPDC
jgi:hypothetical protein